MTAALEDEIKQILIDIAKEKGFCIDHIEIGLDDHIHLLVAAPPKLSVTVIVKYLKGISSFRLFRLHPELKQFYWKKTNPHIWSPSYFVESIGTTNADAVAKYIDDQRGKERKYDGDDHFEQLNTEYTQMSSNAYLSPKQSVLLVSYITRCLN